MSENLDDTSTLDIWRLNSSNNLPPINRKKFSTNIDLVMPEEVNILMIGSQAVGKSSLSNYLCGAEKFKVSRHGIGTTKTSYFSFHVNNSLKLHRIFDTPGFGDKDDVTHLKQMWQIVQKCPIHLIILCLACPFRTSSEKDIQMLKFFKGLLEKVISAGNLVVVLTRAAMEYDKEEREEQEKQKKETCEFVEKYLQQTGLVVEMMDVKKQEEAFWSKDPKARILQMARRKSPVFLDFSIPLPTSFKDKKTNVCLNLTNQLKLYNEKVSEMSRNCINLKQQKKDTDKSIMEIKQEQEKLARPVKSSNMYEYGDDVIHLSRIQNCQIDVPDIIIMEHSVSLKCETWNSDVIEKQITDKKVVFDVVPNFINIEKKQVYIDDKEPQEYRWFAIVWLEYIPHYNPSDYSMQLIDLEKNHNDIVRSLEEEERKNSDPEYKKITEHYKNKEKIVKFLSQEKFTLDKYDDAIKLIERIYKDNDN